MMKIRTIRRATRPARVRRKPIGPDAQRSDGIPSVRRNNDRAPEGKGLSARGRIRVAHITTIDLTIRHFLLNQLRTLQHAGYEIAGISATGPDVTVIEAAGIRHIAVPITRQFRPLADLYTLIRLYQVIRRERFTIVHTHTPKPEVLGQIAARLAGVPITVKTVHGYYFHENMNRLMRRFYIVLEKIASWCSDVILSQNQEDIRMALSERICSREQIKHIGNGIDLRRFDPERILPERTERLRLELGITPGAPVVGYVGRLVAEKGILELFAAARTILRRQPTTRFLLIGPTDEDKPDALKPEVANQYGVREACIFTGWRQDMPELYTLMDVLALPSHREGFPRAPMEASAMKVPSVVTNIRGCREVVEHGRNGLLVPLGDPGPLAEGILELLENPEKARRMGAEGRRVASARFDERLVFEKVKSEYERLLGEKFLANGRAMASSR